MKNLSKKISFSILVLIFFFNASSQECLFNDNTGDDPPYSPGKVTAEEIEVKADVWSDFVFSESYQLRSLK